jgi:hypothetical protein
VLLHLFCLLPCGKAEAKKKKEEKRELKQEREPRKDLLRSTGEDFSIFFLFA